MELVYCPRFHLIDFVYIIHMIYIYGGIEHPTYIEIESNNGRVSLSPTLHLSIFSVRSVFCHLLYISLLGIYLFMHEMIK